ncbi:hypothetical protein V2J09_017490 [Rumex salicifolius]
MSFCKTLARFSLSSSAGRPWRSNRRLPSPSYSSIPFVSLVHLQPCFRRGSRTVRSRTYASLPEALIQDTEEEAVKDNVEQLLSSNGKDDISKLMKMERKSGSVVGPLAAGTRWFPYVSSRDVLDALDTLILDARKERLRNVVRNRTYSVCLVVEGLSDFGNISAAFRSADALGIQSVHVVSCDSSKRYRENRHVSMGAEKWLDIELWDSIRECFDELRSRGYRIATTHIGENSVYIDEMDWSVPTAIVVGNESRGISQEALELSDIHCVIPMRGMVDSFNVSVAAGILMHHAVRDRTSRLGFHGDLTPNESQILLAELSLRHSKTTINIVHEFAKRTPGTPIPKL